MTKNRIYEILYTLAIDHVKCGGQQIVCYLGFDRKWVVGFNRYKTHPMQKKYGRKLGAIYLHSEIDAIQKFLSHYVEINKATLYICRVVHTQLTFGKPCLGCLRAIYAFNIRHVYYSAPEGYRKLF